MTKTQKSLNDYTSTSQGLDSILDGALQSYERLPMLQVIFEKIARLLTISMRSLTAESVSIKVSGFASMRFGNYVTALEHPSCIVIYKVVELENYGLLVIDNHLIYGLIDILLGGKKNTKESYNPNKFFTYIEQEIVKQISNIILNDVGSAFDQISLMNFVFDRVENNPNFVSIARPGDAMIIFVMNVEIDNKVGKMSLAIPYATIEPLKHKLAQLFVDSHYASDGSWRSKLRARIHDIELPLTAIIKSKNVKMSKIAKLKIGDTLLLDQSADPEIDVVCEDTTIFKGKIGKIQDQVAVNVSEVAIISNKREM